MGWGAKLAGVRALGCQVHFGLRAGFTSSKFKALLFACAMRKSRRALERLVMRWNEAQHGILARTPKGEGCGFSIEQMTVSKQHCLSDCYALVHSLKLNQTSAWP